ncbi:unnamed protein product [Adineta steineri]|uniref:Arrestin C-terminal-like domain-containing protein n=1 Tax=Adineta steineri TaxID=433720 RepID=A0A814WCD6_9BILA|nr:unnamed protein product [Adineta steineri]CAF1200463.1 unnamed protein product [Adineta steineri]
MGSSSSSLTIELDRNPPLYYGGELLKGAVRLQPDDVQFNAKELSLKVEGKTVGNDLVQHTALIGVDYTNIEVKECIFFKKHIILAKPTPGEDKFLVSKNQNTWTFEIELPTYAPPTFSLLQNLYQYQHQPAVHFIVETNLKKSFSSLTNKKAILFRPSVFIKTRTPASWSIINRQMIQLNIHIPQGIAYVSGEIINGIIEFNNPRHIRIKRIECKVLQTLIVGYGSYRSSIVKFNVPKISDTNEESRKEIFQIQLPQDLPPSYNYSPNEQSQHKATIVEYSLSFMVRVIGILSDIEVVKPLLIGTNPCKHEENGTIILKDKRPPKQLPPISTQQSIDKTTATIPLITKEHSSQTREYNNYGTNIILKNET